MLERVARARHGVGRNESLQRVDICSRERLVESAERVAGLCTRLGADQRYVRRLATTVGAPLFARAGRGLALTARGERLLRVARPQLQALVDAATSPATFDAKTSDRIVRLGLSDSSEDWLLPPLLRTDPIPRTLSQGVVVPGPYPRELLSEEVRNAHIEASNPRSKCQVASLLALRRARRSRNSTL
jgi:hypothetical protein